MDSEPHMDRPEFGRQLQLLEELTELTRQQERAGQIAEAEARRLRSVVEDGANRLTEMLAGQRASRAELQALIDTLRVAVEPVVSADT